MNQQSASLYDLCQSVKYRLIAMMCKHRRASRLGKRRSREERQSGGTAWIEALEPRKLLSGGAMAAFDVPSDPIGGQTISVEVASLNPAIDRAGIRGADRLTLRLNGSNLELVDRRGNVLLDEAVADVASLNIVGRADRSDHLTVDFAFGGPFSIPGGVSYDGGNGSRTDQVRFIGDPAGGVVSLNGTGLTANGVTFSLVNVEHLLVTTGAGNDAIGISGTPDFAKARINDAGGDDTYNVDMIGGAISIHDRNGNDDYHLTPTGGSIRISDRNAGMDTIDFSAAPNGVDFALVNRTQSIGLGSSTIRLGGRYEVVVGSPFADHITGDSRGNLLLGGNGEDTLDGRRGRDILIGGPGADALLGAGGEAVLIGGTTIFDGHSADRSTLLGKWATGGSFADRVDAIRFPGDVLDSVFLVNGTTTLDDGADDQLDGGRSRDFAPLGANDGGLTDIELTIAPFLQDFDAASFSDSLTIDNTFMPLPVGGQFIYEGDKVDEDSGETETERVVLDVMGRTETILGVAVVSVRDQAFVDDVIEEDTIDYFAQDDAGNVWYFGEFVVNYEYDDDGNLIATNNDGSWIAGENSALPGIVMPGAPVIGHNYYQEFAPLDDALDEAINVADDGQVQGPLGNFADVLVVREFNQLEPDALENKNYAPGIGLVLVQEDLDDEGDPDFVLELISLSLTAAPTLADFAGAEFSDSLTIDNTFMPLPVGGRFIYEGDKVDEDSGETETERVVLDVLGSTETILGVAVLSVRDQAFVDDVIEEDTIDYFARDDAGNVWYFGEFVVNYEYDDEGILIATNNDGSWIAGENSALPGIVMPGTPVIGHNYYQEFAPLDDALDEAINFADDGEVSGPLGDYTGVLVVREFKQFEPDALENKNYAPGIGLVLIEEDLDDEGDPDFVLELISIDLP
jgi:hypothetical protein